MSVSFHQFDIDTFELALERISDQFYKINPPNTKELVYALPTPKEDVVIAVFSTIDPNTRLSRKKGNDAIRVVGWSLRHNRPMGGEKRTQRIQLESGEKRWPVNMKKKIESQMKNWRRYSHECEECESHMAYREGKYGPFVSCMNRNCDKTKGI